MTSIPPPPLSGGSAPLIGPQRNHPRAVAAIVCGGIGLVYFGVILGVVAVVLGTQAMKLIDLEPMTFKGSGLAKAGRILGIIDIAFFVLFAVLSVGVSKS